MESDLLKEYQKRCGEVIARNKSVLDILSKLQCANSRVTRSVVKAVTSCGCIEIDGRKNSPVEAGSQISGNICEDCENTIKTELGEAFFYTVSLCNALGISMEDVVRWDLNRSDMMGMYSLR
ncbi:MAG: DUF1573 domain-containing protein [Clostridia bacterium]